ncbi:MAG: hypothetical protein Kow0062_00230 [Acidobacteriota bacterium]
MIIAQRVRSTAGRQGRFLVYLLAGSMALAGAVGAGLAQLNPVRLQGELVFEDIEPADDLVVVFEPASADSTEQRRELKANRKGRFGHSFFPAGRYKVTIKDDRYFIKSMNLDVRDRSGALLYEHVSDADPEKGLPPVKLMAGAVAKLKLVVTGASYRNKLRQAAAFREFKGPLEKVRHAFEAGEMKRVIELTDEVLAKEPDLGQVLYVRGVALTKLGRPREAVEALERSAELTPDQPGVYGALGTALLKLAQDERERGADEAQLRATYEKAIEAFRKELERLPDDEALKINLGIALRDAGRADEAVEQFMSIIEEHPDFQDAYFQVYALLEKLGRHDEALRVLEKAPGADSEVAKALYNQAVQLYDEKRYDDALALLERVAAKDPSLALQHHLRGFVLMALGRIDEAVAELERFVELAPDHPEAETDRALIAALKDQQQK